MEASSFDELSTDRVAEEAGISRSLLFHYFPTKEDFVVALAEDASRDLLEVTAPTTGLPPLGRLREALASFIDYVEERRDLYLALIRGAAGGGPTLQAVFDRTRGLLAERILDGLGLEPQAAPAPIRAVARGYIGFTEEVVVTWLREDGDQMPRDQLLELLEAIGAAVFAAAGVPLEALTGEEPAPRARS